MRSLVIATTLFAVLFSSSAHADVSKTCKRTLTSSMIEDVGRDTAREMMKVYVPKQVMAVYNAHRSERTAEAKEMATSAAETIISVTIEMLEKKGMPALSEECVDEVRKVVLRGTAVVVPELEQKLIALAKTDDVVRNRDRVAEKASNELASAYQQVTVIGAAGVVATVKE